MNGQTQEPEPKGEGTMPDAFYDLVQASYTDACAVRAVASFASLGVAASPALHNLVTRSADELDTLALILQRLPDDLAWHHLTGVECDPVARTDVATCGCALWRSEPQPSAGGAVQAWVAHVMAELRRPVEEDA